MLLLRASREERESLFVWFETLLAKCKFPLQLFDDTSYTKIMMAPILAVYVFPLFKAFVSSGYSGWRWRGEHRWW